MVDSEQLQAFLNLGEQAGFQPDALGGDFEMNTPAFYEIREANDAAENHEAQKHVRYSRAPECECRTHSRGEYYQEHEVWDLSDPDVLREASTLSDHLIEWQCGDEIGYGIMEYGVGPGYYKYKDIQHLPTF